MIKLFAAISVQSNVALNILPPHDTYSIARQPPLVTAIKNHRIAFEMGKWCLKLLVGKVYAFSWQIFMGYLSQKSSHENDLTRCYSDIFALGQKKGGG